MNRTAGPLLDHSRNDLILGATLVSALGIGLVVRLCFIRVLGPAAFGEMHFAETAAEMLLVILTLGVDAVIRREAVTEPARAHQYLFGLLAIRLLAGAILVALGVTWFIWTGRTTIQVSTFALLGLAQILLTLNTSYTALELASGSVSSTTKIMLGFKCVWAGLAMVVLLIAPAAVPFAAVLLLTETLRFARLSSRAIKRTSVTRPDMGTAVMIAGTSMPFVINFVAYSTAARLGTWWLGVGTGGREVGYYGAASALAATAMLAMPVVSRVLLPSATRATKETDSPDGALLGGTLRVALLASMPAAILIAIWAPDLLTTLLGAAYLPATWSVRALAMTVGLGAVATVCSISLIQQHRGRTLAIVSVGGLLTSLALNAALIPWGRQVWGGGGAASGAALATLGTDALVTAALLHLTWHPAWAVPVRRSVAGLSVGGLLAALIRTMPLPAPGAALLSAVCLVGVLVTMRAVDRADLTFLRGVRPTEARRAPFAT